LLTDEQRAELESHDPATVRTKLIQAGPGRGASVSGFKTGELTRGDVEDWLVEKHRPAGASAPAATAGALMVTLGVT
jgi:hypothetical protein